MKKITLLFLFIPLCFYSKAQQGNNQDIPPMRQYFHEMIDATQKLILASDGNADELFTPTQSDSLNNLLTNSLIQGVDDIQTGIEKNDALDNNLKIKFLRGLNEALSIYLREFRNREIKAIVLVKLVPAFNENIGPQIRGESIEMNIASYPYDVGNILLKSVAFSDNAGIAQCRDIVLLKYCNLHPDKAMNMLSEEPDARFADSLIVAIARRSPENIYTFAAASNALARKIQNNPDTLVQIIVKMSQSKSGRQFFPFLDNIYKGKITMGDIEKAMKDDVTYYQLLVQTEIDYADRIRHNDTPMAMKTLAYKLQDKAIDPFINTINGLHEQPNDVRFHILNPLRAEDLYYMAVMGEEIMYTSSYVSGVYPRIWQKMKNPKSDSLMLDVKFDRFKKWIKMAANYNELDDFLKRMDKGNAELIMKAFVNNLDRKSGADSLEDAVDVANSFASISDKALQQLILKQVQANLTHATKMNNRRAIDIYSILNTLFLSIDPANKIDVEKTLGIPPVYFMPNKELRDSSGRIIIQQFFYGDKDGQGVFNNFVNSMQNGNWTMKSNPQWVAFSTTKGTPITVYANRPLDEKKGLDAEAQQALDDYLFDNDLSPVIVIHRGHSYWLPSTLDQMSPTSKIVLLGSCGAYQNLNKILAISPSAQIVASKQVGSGTVNSPMISMMLEILRQGKDVNWPEFWNTLGKRLGGNALFEDYVPPQKNLGALFIMAYKKLQEKNDELVSN
ncbi:MAG: hypothetical protein JSS67_04190 [Bacteroidetes bacterium]|nr:hypothetical protein [Bacteroidota bacterium]